MTVNAVFSVLFVKTLAGAEYGSGGFANIVFQQPDMFHFHNYYTAMARLQEVTALHQLLLHCPDFNSTRNETDL